MIVGSWPQPALAQLSCSVTEISPDSNNGHISYGPGINGDGTRIIFTSEQDPTGGNPDHNQEAFLFNTITSTFTQLTSTSGDRFGSGTAISSDGKIILVFSNADLTGGNLDGSGELFLFDTTTNTFTQISNIASPFVGSINGGAINASGTRVAFMSTADLTGGNLDLNSELFLFDSTTNTTTQITNTTGNVNFAPISINAAGSRIAFYSFANFTGGNSDGNREIFVFDTTTNTFTQITNTFAGDNIEPSISADSSHLAFVSTANLTGGNSDGNDEIFLFNTTTNTFTQITNTTGNGNFGPQSNADGSRIAWRDAASGDVFLFDASTQTITDIQGSGSGDHNVAINADGSRIAIGSNFNIYLGSCGAPTGADLALTITDTPDPETVSQPLTYTLTVTNNGPSPASGVTVTDTLPSTVTIGSASPSQGNCSVSSPTVTCSLGSLANGASATVTITVTPSVTGTLTNTPSVSGTPTDPNTSNNSATATTSVVTKKQAINLMVTIQGQGSVVSNPPGINCRATACAATFASGTTVSLTATPASGWKFSSWSGECTGTANPCTVSMTQDRKVSATFVKAK